MKENILSIQQVCRFLIAVVGFDAGYYNHSNVWYAVGFLGTLSFAFSLLFARPTRLAH